MGVVYAPETIANTASSQLGIDIDGEAQTDFAGTSVSMSSDGNRVAIGARLNDGTGSNAGHVRIYEWSGTDWTKAGDDIDGEAAGDQSGYSVSLSSDGSRVAIGAPRNDGNGSNAGHVRIYDYNGTNWTQTGLDIDGEAESDESGISVSLSSDGNRVAIGAPGNDGTGSNAGHVRIYDYNGTNWTKTGSDIDGEAGNDQGGTSVSLSSDGNRVAIGAPQNGGNGSGAGHVRIYDYNGTNWTQTGPDIDGEAESDQSGWSLSLSSDGSRVAIGAFRNDGTASNAGHVRIYDYNGTNWTQTGLDIDGEAESDESGISVSLSSDGRRVAIGARNNDGTASNAGHVRIYDYNGTAWSQDQDVDDFDGEATGDQSGYSVSLSSDGRRVAIGAIRNDGNGTMAGHTRVFPLPALPAAPAAAAAPAAPAAPAALYQGPLPFIASPGTASAGGEITITGIRLNSISSVQIDDVAAAIVSVEETSLVFTLPNGLEAGTKSIVFYGSQGKLTFFSRLEYKAAPPPAAVQPETDLEKVNAGSFDGYVAAYAKGHEGKTLSWRIAGKWFKTEITSNYQVFQRKTAAVGVDVKVDLYIDGESQLSKLVRTR